MSDTSKTLTPAEIRARDNKAAADAAVAAARKGWAGKPADQASTGAFGSRVESSDSFSADATKTFSPGGQTLTPAEIHARDNKAAADAVNAGPPGKTGTSAGPVTKPTEHRLPQKGEPGYELRPGDVGYAPPARIANLAGTVLTSEQLGHHPGVDPALNSKGEVNLAMPPPAPATLAGGAPLTKPSQMEKGAATVQFATMVESVRAWVMDNPHPLAGEQAVVAQFFRDLAGRRAALGTAAQLGRTVAPDAVDQAETIPPPEFFQLHDLAQQMVEMNRIYAAQMNRLGVELTGQDKLTINSIVAKFKALADGPAAPAEVIGADKPPAPPPAEVIGADKAPATAA